MDLIHAIIFGVVEGITEFLPVSSTGHLILTARLLGLSQTDFLKSFQIAIQLGAILAVVVLYGKTLLFDCKVFKRIMAAFIPTAIIGFIFYKIIKMWLGDSHIVLWALFLGGVFLIVFDLWHREDAKAIAHVEDISYRTASLIGLFQALSMIPGVSRAAATIIGGLVLGVQRKTIVEFSFLLAIPTMAAATGFDLLKNAHVFSFEHWRILTVGFGVSFIVALASIRFLLHYIQKHNFVVFGVYRILVVIIFLLIGV